MTTYNARPPSLLDAARALAMARERYQFLLNAKPSTHRAACDVGDEKDKAYLAEQVALAALDAAYRREEYGEEAK
jgi:hypothetical protein